MTAQPIHSLSVRSELFAKRAPDIATTRNEHACHFADSNLSKPGAYSIAMTPQRFARLNAVLDARQPDLTVVMDNVHKTHNFSAILRSCDAVGVVEVHAVWPNPRLRPNRPAASGAGKWVQVNTHGNIESAVNRLKAHDFQVIAAHPNPKAVDFRQVDYTRPTALLMGAELEGVSDIALACADRWVFIPMNGMVASLNVSVAAATLLFEAQRQRLAAGLYDRPRLDREQRQKILFRWAHPQVARYCDKHGIVYPTLTEEGELAEPLPRA